jgi:hypothetical protein
VELIKERAFTNGVYSFSANVPSSDGTIRQRFEWRHSEGLEMKALSTENMGKENYSRDDRGLKLVNVDTRQLLAVFVAGKQHRVYNPKKIAGKLRFISVEHEYNEFRKVVLLSILSIMERK